MSISGLTRVTGMLKPPDKEFKMFMAYFYKVIRSPLFYIGIAGVVGICALRLLPSAFKGIDVLMEMEVLRSLDGYRKVFVILGALPFAANFSDEWNSMVTTNCVTRKGAGKYAVSNAIMCYVSALAVVFIGMMIFAGIYSMFYPFYFAGGGSGSSPYGIFTLSGFPILDLAATTFVFSASCAMWAVMGQMLTAFFPSKYIAICAPFVFSYAIERLTMNFPEDFNLWSLSLSYTDWSALPAFIFANALFMGIAVICGIVFVKTVERKIQNGCA